MARYARPGCPEVELSLRVLLDGPYDEGLQLMHDSLRAQGLLPVSEPYTGLGFTPGDPLAAAPGILGTTGPDAIVDWLLVELRDAAQPANVIGSRVALVQRDGDVVAPDGASTVRFCDPGTPVHVAVRHRNHLGVMTAASFTLGATPTVIDLSDAGTATFGTDARRDRNGTRLLWTGNSALDDEVRYTGTSNDRDAILQAVGGVVPTAVASGYLAADVDLDGTVKYAGQGNDRDRVLQTIGGAVPTAVRTEQLP